MTDKLLLPLPSIVARADRHYAGEGLADAVRDYVAEREREIARLQSLLSEWEKLCDPVMLHANLLRGIPCKLDRETFLHLAGDKEQA